ncbi:MAG TPA: threonine synthase [Micropepsaceae bacterium]|nr:threonine synthase [Micropepsaceae bacterium]
MQYVSTRGGDGASFADVLLGGPAPDGGLYLPEHWPQFAPSTIAGFASLPYAEVAFRIMRPFINDAFTHDDFRADVEAAYAAFAHKAVAPLVQLAPDFFLLELFHGPTLAFKDVAMQLMGRLFARALAQQGRRATVIVATSGDTGSAAIAALRGQNNVDVVVLHPKGRVSEVQRRQMTSVLDSNIHNIALEGSFDDTQNIVKTLFAESEFATRTNLAAVNSINFARIVSQCVYYFTAAASLGAGVGRQVNFVVPTGNFGDIFAGEAAARMGLPIGRLVIATNQNDILPRTLETGRYETGRATPTLSPSMDIQVASNFERALFEASERDAAFMSEAMRGFAVNRALRIPSQVLKVLRDRYFAARATDQETVAAIARVYKDSGLVIDPHTAVGVVAAEKLAGQLAGPTIALATAHPAKFSGAVTRAIGKASDLPPHLADLLSREERYTVLANSTQGVKEFVLEHTQQR